MNTKKFLFQVLPTLLFITFVATNATLANSETAPEKNNKVNTKDSSADKNQRTVPFITLRNKTGSENVSDFFGGERSDLRAGYCDLSHRPLNFLKPVAKVASFYVPDEIVKLDAVRLSAIEDLWSVMASTLNGQSPVLYTHGFFISFERGCRRASLLQESLGLNGRFVLFSWPSDGVIVNYTRDESDLFWSVDPLYQTLLDMIDRFGTGKVNLVAHSLGSRGVMLALIRLAQAKHGNKPLVNQVVLAAPDIDAGIFEQYLPLIRPLARNITVYVSNKDSALAVSRQLHGYPRLGEAGAHLEGLAGVEIIDISDIPVRQPSGHVYHLYHNDVVNDLKQLLNENKPASQRRNLKKGGKNHWHLQQGEADK